MFNSRRMGQKSEADAFQGDRMDETTVASSIAIAAVALDIAIAATVKARARTPDEHLQNERRTSQAFGLARFSYENG